VRRGGAGAAPRARFVCGGVVGDVGAGGRCHAHLPTHGQRVRSPAVVLCVVVLCAHSPGTLQPAPSIRPSQEDKERYDRETEQYAARRVVEAANLDADTTAALLAALASGTVPPEIAMQLVAQQQQQDQQQQDQQQQDQQQLMLGQAGYAYGDGGGGEHYLNLEWGQQATLAGGLGVAQHAQQEEAEGPEDDLPRAQPPKPAAPTAKPLSMQLPPSPDAQAALLGGTSAAALMPPPPPVQMQGGLMLPPNFQYGTPLLPSALPPHWALTGGPPAAATAIPPTPKSASGHMGLHTGEVSAILETGLDASVVRGALGRLYAPEAFYMLVDAWRSDSGRVRDAVRSWKTYIEGGLGWVWAGWVG